MQSPDVGSATSCIDINFVCDICGAPRENHKKLAVHRWAKRRITANVRTFIGDTSICAICGTDFFSRARLVKHLLERRVRSKTRGASCQAAFLQSNPAPVPATLLHELESRDAAAFKAERKEGHTSTIAGRPCRRTQTSVLSMPPPPKRRRLVHKMPAPAAYVQHAQGAAL